MCLPLLTEYPFVVRNGFLKSPKCTDQSEESIPSLKTWRLFFVGLWLDERSSLLWRNIRAFVVSAHSKQAEAAFLLLEASVDVGDGPCGWLVHVVSLSVFLQQKILVRWAPHRPNCVCVFPFLKAAFMLCSVLLVVSAIPLPPVPTWILDQCYWFKNRFAVKCRSGMDLNQRVFSCPLFLPPSPRFIDRLTDKGTIIACGIPNVVVGSCCGLFIHPHQHLSHFDWSPLKMDRNWLWKYSKHKPDLSPRCSNRAWTHLEQLSSGSLIFTDLRN